VYEGRIGGCGVYIVPDQRRSLKCWELANWRKFPSKWVFWHPNHIPVPDHNYSEIIFFILSKIYHKGPSPTPNIFYNTINCRLKLILHKFPAQYLPHIELYKKSCMIKRGINRANQLMNKLKKKLVMKRSRFMGIFTPFQIFSFIA